MKIYTTLLVAVFAMFSLEATAIKNVTEIEGKKFVDGQEYQLSWSSEFNDSKGAKPEGWRPRFVTTTYGNQYSTDEDAFCDGEGNLILRLREIPAEKVIADAKSKGLAIANSLLELPSDTLVPTTTHLISDRSFKYGYFELRFKIPSKIRGYGMTFWFPNHASRNDTEIDIIESSLYNKSGKLVDYKSSTIHWYPGGYHTETGGLNRANHQFMSVQMQKPTKGQDEATEDMAKAIILQESDKKLFDPKSNVIDLSENGKTRKVIHTEDNTFRWDDDEFHTVALLWTPEQYSFYYDGVRVAKFEEGISHFAQNPILWARTFAKGLENSPENMPAEFIVDYMRVYKPTDNSFTPEIIKGSGTAKAVSAEKLFDGMKISAAPADKAAYKVIEQDGVATLDIKLSEHKGWPQININLPESIGENNALSMKVKLVAPEKFSYGILATVYPQQDWNSIYINKELIAGEFVEIIIPAKNNEAKEATSLRISARNPNSECNLQIIDIKLIKQDKDVK